MRHGRAGALAGGRGKALKPRPRVPKTGGMGRPPVAVTRLPPMSAVPSWFKPLKQIVDVIFRHDVVLRRDADGVRLVLNDRATGGDTARVNPAAQAAAKESLELELMRSQLAAVLDERPETRSTLRHLAFVDDALGKKGLRALDELPLDLMRHALDQFEGLVINWSPAGLASLRSKMAVATIRRESMDPDAGPDPYRTSAVLEPAPPRDAANVVALKREDEEALAAAYAAYAACAALRNPTVPSAEVEMHGEPDSPSARAARAAAVETSPPQANRLRQLET